jgi:hypothetical protein
MKTLERRFFPAGFSRPFIKRLESSAYGAVSDKPAFRTGGWVPLSAATKERKMPGAATLRSRSSARSPQNLSRQTDAGPSDKAVLYQQCEALDSSRFRNDSDNCGLILAPERAPLMRQEISISSPLPWPSILRYSEHGGGNR